MFLIKYVDIGTVRFNSKNIIYFPYDTLGKITGVELPCSCTDIDNDEAKSRISVTYNAQPIPKHFTDMNKTSYPVTKTIKISWMNPDGSVTLDELKITGTVTS